MSRVLHARLALVWLGLVVASLVSFWLGTDHGFTGDDGKKLGMSVAFVVAFLKIQVIGSQFMELRTAPPALRAAFGAWCAGTCTVVITLFLTA